MVISQSVRLSIFLVSATPVKWLHKFSTNLEVYKHKDLCIWRKNSNSYDLKKCCTFWSQNLNNIVNQIYVKVMIIKKVYHEIFILSFKPFSYLCYCKTKRCKLFRFFGGGGREKQTNKEKLKQVQVHIDK